MKNQKNKSNKILTMFLIIILCLTLLPTLAFAKSSKSVTRVSGYTRKNGTYVKPYYRTSKNSTVSDNFSHIGNYNPYTGEWGTKID